MLADQILDRKGREVATVTPETSITDALATLAEHNVGALVVSGDGAAVDGILSERDIVRSLARDGADAMTKSAADLMVSPVATCDGHMDTATMMDTMTEGRFRHLPVVDDGSLVGIISIGDVVKVRIEELAAEREQLVGYIRDGR